MATNTIFSKQPTGNAKLGKRGKMWSTYRTVTKTLDKNGVPLDGTCPKDCPFLTMCYANYSFTNIHQNRAKGVSDCLIAHIAKLPTGAKVRHLVSGDFGMNDKLDDYLDEAIEAHEARPDVLGYSYTHHWRNFPVDRFNKVDNFVVNASCESTEEVKLALKNGWLAVQVVPEETPDTVDFGDYKLVICPQQTKGKTCEECMLCARPKRKVVIGFRSHGNNKKTIAGLVENVGGVA